MKPLKTLDYTLLLTTVFLVAFGILMVFSASSILAQERFHDGSYFLKKEVVFALLGAAGLIAAKRLPLSQYPKLVYPALGLAALLLVLVFVPHVGARVGGASRWLRVGPLSLQPSELAKIPLLLFLAYVLAKKKERIRTFAVGFLPPMVISGVLIGLVLLGKDMGTAVVMLLTVFLMMFVGGTRLSYLATELILALPAFYVLISSVGYRRQRILAFLNPWDYQREAGFQIIQSYVAFQAGGFWGLGLGEGKQKLFYLPEAHTDFILSVIGEELGLVGTGAVLVLFLIWITRAFVIGWKSKNLFAHYLAIGIAVMTSLQVVLNMGVVMGLLPTKGLPLPFISYGGTSLLVMLILTGILLNISSQAEEGEER